MDYKIKNMNYRVYFQGNIGEDKINLVYIPKEKFFTEKGKNIIEEKWIKKEGEGAYNGDLIELVDFNTDGDILNICFDYTKYKFSIVNRDPEYQKENCYITNHIAIPTAVKTKDNKFMFITSKEVRNGKCHWKFVGGYWEKQAPKISDNVIKEINEEIGLGNYVNNIRIIGIAERDHSTCIATMVDCLLTSNEVEKYIEENRINIVDSNEAAEFKFIDFTKEGIENILNDDSISYGGMAIFTLDSLYKIL